MFYGRDLVWCEKYFEGDIIKQHMQRLCKLMLNFGLSLGRLSHHLIQNYKIATLFMSFVWWVIDTHVYSYLLFSDFRLANFSCTLTKN
jgi:hypothetical protein